MYTGDQQPRPALGDSWRPQAHHRLLLIPQPQDQAALSSQDLHVQATVVASPCVQLGTHTSFTITSKQLVSTDFTEPQQMQE